MASNNRQSIDRQAAEAAAWLRDQWPRTPRYGIVLGTGAGQVAQAITVEAEFPYDTIPNFPRSTAIGHEGKLICGSLCGWPVVAMKGRFHLYEGYSSEISTIGIRVMIALGIESLFLSNAAGGINPKFMSGDIMLIDSHLDLMFHRAQPPKLERNDGLHPVIRERNPVLHRADTDYDGRYAEAAFECARRENFALFRGVYVGMLGPNYETRAEYRALRRLGGDTVGMSTIPEVAVASAAGLRILAASIVTNVAKPDVLDRTTGEDVVHFADIAAPKLLKLFVSAIQSDRNAG
jgi:purine-nucleoside phosphorylase